ncbi:hypothetical protein HYY69_04540 [Candidatus Woesearchaeota archaeon]|nr:hypothetical protein [Candidatus Woesearchaeota archaeon]
MLSINKIAKEMLEELQQNPYLSKQLIAAWYEDDNKFYEICKSIDRLEVNILSDKELFELFKIFCQQTIKRETSSSIIDGFALGSDTFVAEQIQDFLKIKGREKEFTKLFPILTAPTKQSFINEAEVSLLKIAFLKKDHQQYADCLKDHQERYFWSKNNYVQAHYLDQAYFEKEINHLLNDHKTKEDLQQHIDKLERTPIKNKEAKTKLIKELPLSPYIISLLTISDDFTWWQDERKKSTYWYIHYGCKLLEEIAKRKGFTLHQLKYTTPPEILSMLEGKTHYTHDQLNARIKECAYYWNPDQFECITDKKQLEELKNIILKKQDYSKITSFKGLCANSGKVNGMVKIVKSATEVHKIEKGDILVAVMTRPDYITGMKKAAAIVTNEGGITCHAAIVSREINIPCIIGTKIATEVLKDGMMIEVDANNGIVKILN